ncbi:fimbrial protein [Lelliottia amnigena]|jgi:major type 1 subunit fimbrin (pilin)|uniref:fimbrial protein n=1 Tax=Lelliottia amnigena TaxID=61646 RepID=UPI000F9D5973|nr:type 1 fimbrial protein [Lelliottia amnigena]MCU7784374.1 type 1 fimbrial protein [Lelliottia amnigena]
MKKTLMALTFMSFAMAGTAQAEDHSATVNIHASLTNSISKCQFDTADTTVNLKGDIGEFPNEGENARTPTKIPYHISDTCDINTFALQLRGINGSTGGTVLYNSDESELGAKGIGVGIYGSDLSPMQINSVIPIPPTISGRYINFELAKFKGQLLKPGYISSALTIDIVHL